MRAKINSFLLHLINTFVLPSSGFFFLAIYCSMEKTKWRDVCDQKQGKFWPQNSLSFIDIYSMHSIYAEVEIPVASNWRLVVD